MARRLSAGAAGAFHSRYAREKVLGHGCFGEVWLCRHRSSGDRFAVKVKAPHFGIGQCDETMEDFEALRQLTPHPGLVRIMEPPVIDVKGSTKAVYLVTEFVERGSLAKYVLESGVVTASVVAGIIRQILEALQHCHASGLCHNDVKPENVLVAGVGGTGTDGCHAVPMTLRVHVILADFGQASRAGSPANGDPRYAAPEMWPSGVAQPSADIWMVGVTAFELLTGVLPFLKRSLTLDDFCAQGLDQKMRQMLKLKDPGIELVRNAMRGSSSAKAAAECLEEVLLSKDPRLRVDAGRALSQAWLCTPGDSSLDGHLTSVEQLQRHARRSWLHRELRLAVVTRVQTAVLFGEGSPQAAIFQGAAAAGHLRRDAAVLLFMQHLQVQREYAEQLFDAMDADGNGELDVDELAAVAVDMGRLPESAFQIAFQAMDADGDGFITADELSRFGRATGWSISEENVRLALRELDEDKNGSISYDEFRRFLVASSASAATDMSSLQPCASGPPQLSYRTMRGDCGDVPCRAQDVDRCTPQPMPRVTGQQSKGLPAATSTPVTSAGSQTLRNAVPLLAFRQLCGGGTSLTTEALATALSMPLDHATVLMRDMGAGADGRLSSDAFLRWWGTTTSMELTASNQGEFDKPSINGTLRSKRGYTGNMTERSAVEVHQNTQVGVCGGASQGEGDHVEDVLRAVAKFVNEGFQGKPREAFKRLCGVACGKLSADMLATGTLYDGLAAKPSWVQKVVTLYDKDGDGLIGLGEFIHMYSAACNVPACPTPRKRRRMSC